MGMIIGGLHELGRAYMETKESPHVRDDRNFDGRGLGWYRDRIISVTYACLKKDRKAILAAIDAHPTSLITNAGCNADGTTATLTDWGPGYELLDTDTPNSGSPSLCRLQLRYRKRIPEAVAAPPAGVSISCLAGVCSVAWQGNTFLNFNSLVSANEPGIEFVKLPLEARGSTVSAQGAWFFLPLQINCNGVEVSTFRARFEGTPPYQWVNTTDYPGNLYWRTSGKTAELIWANAVVWKYVNP